MLILHRFKGKCNVTNVVCGHQSETVHTLVASDLRGVGRGLGTGAAFTVCDDAFFIALGEFIRRRKLT